MIPTILRHEYFSPSVRSIRLHVYVYPSTVLNFSILFLWIVDNDLYKTLLKALAAIPLALC